MALYNEIDTLKLACTPARLHFADSLVTLKAFDALAVARKVSRPALVLSLATELDRRQNIVLDMALKTRI